MQSEEMHGFRAPTEEESARICKWFSAYHRAGNVLAVIFGVVLCFVGIVLLIANSTSEQTELVIGALCLTFGLRSFFSIRKTNKQISRYRAGDFMIADGSISRNAGRTQRAGFSIVYFRSAAGEEEGPYTVNTETAIVGLPAILVCLTSGTGKKPIKRIFTQWMLTEEGIRKHF